MGVVIPHSQLSDDALRGVLEEFINREGTDYGEAPADLETKLAQLRAQLDSGRIALLYDEESATVNLVTAEALARAEDRGNI